VTLLFAAACGSTPLPEGEIPREFRFEYERDRPPTQKQLPKYVSIEVDDRGEISYEVHHTHPKPAKKKGELSLGETSMEKLYDEIRNADLYGLSDEYEGQDPELGRETFRVIGVESEEKTITVDGTSVARLERLTAALLDILPAEEILSYPKSVAQEVIMDKRTGEFFPARHPLVEQIPEEFRVRHRNKWTALNAGGWPSKEVPELHDQR
jgi:hypothetical protein